MITESVKIKGSLNVLHLDASGLIKDEKTVDNWGPEIRLVTEEDLEKMYKEKERSTRYFLLKN